MPETLSVTTCLWFEKNGIDAARFYVSLLPGSRLVTEAGDGESPMIVDFYLAGVPYRILNGGPHFKLTPVCSISVTTPDQAETDRLWEALTAHGGREERCGWLVDPWGVSWQVFPEALPRMLGAADRAAAGRAQAAMLAMNRIDIAAIEAAFDGR